MPVISPTAVILNLNALTVGTNDVSIRLECEKDRIIDVKKGELTVTAKTLVGEKTYTYYYLHESNVIVPANNIDCEDFNTIFINKTLSTGGVATLNIYGDNI